MKARIVLATALIASFATPAFAEEYYIVRDSTTKKCIIVDKKPTMTTTVTQVGPVTFKSRTEAEAGMKKETVCVEK